MNAHPPAAVDAHLGDRVTVRGTVIARTPDAHPRRWSLFTLALADGTLAYGRTHGAWLHRTPVGTSVTLRATVTDHILGGPVRGVVLSRTQAVPQRRRPAPPAARPAADPAPLGA